MATDRDAHRRLFCQQAAALLAAAVLGEDAAGAVSWLAAGGQAGDERRYPIPGADGVSIDREGQVMLARSKGQAYAFSLSCPHENTALRWRQNDVRFQCPRHESKYAPDGTFLSGRATRNIDRFAIRREGSTLIVNVNRLYRSDTNAAEWRAASVPVI
jgi:Rieske Fe-S protein